MFVHRVIFGLLMTTSLTILVFLDAWFDGSLLPSMENKPVQATLFCIFIALVSAGIQIELYYMLKKKAIKIYLPISIPLSVLLATSFYVCHIFPISLGSYILYVTGGGFLALIWYHYFRYGTESAVQNCGANLFGIIYTGLLSAFILGIRIDFGLWQLVTYLFVIKCTDTGAYCAGKLLGKRKFSPKISPNKTWEGMIGGLVLAVIVSVIFSLATKIMEWPLAVLFGIIFAFAGQVGDLTESIIKRDTEQKDSANHVPGYGGVLDVVDSPLAASILCYVFFSLTAMMQ